MDESRDPLVILVVRGTEPHPHQDEAGAGLPIARSGSYRVIRNKYRQTDKEFPMPVNTAWCDGLQRPMAHISGAHDGRQA